MVLEVRDEAGDGVAAAAAAQVDSEHLRLGLDADGLADMEVDRFALSVVVVGLGGSPEAEGLPGREQAVEEGWEGGDGAGEADLNWCSADGAAAVVSEGLKQMARRSAASTKAR